MPAHDRYGSDVLNTDWRAPRRGRAVEISADKGLVVEEVTADWCGEIVAVERDLMTVTLEDRRGRRRTFPLGAGFLLGGGPGAPGEPDLRRGPPRRGAGGEGVGRRPAHRGGGGGVPRGRGRPGRAPAGFPPGPGATGRGAGRPPGG